MFQSEINVNQVQVNEGWCWWFSKFAPKDSVLQQFAQEAKEAKKGLWADPNPTPPWLYRRLDAGRLSLKLSLPVGLPNIINELVRGIMARPTVRLRDS